MRRRHRGFYGLNPGGHFQDVEHRIAKGSAWIVSDKAKGDHLEKLKQCTSYHFDAPLALMVCYDKTTVWKNRTNGTIGGDVDASIVTTHMMLEVAELGLATTWAGAFDHQKARELFNIPDYLVPVALLPIGYAADGVEPHPLCRDAVDQFLLQSGKDALHPGIVAAMRHAVSEYAKPEDVPNVFPVRWDEEAPGGRGLLA